MRRYALHEKIYALKIEGMSTLTFIQKRIIYFSLSSYLKNGMVYREEGD